MDLQKIESEPNFHLVIGNSNIEHSTEKVVEEVKQFKEEMKMNFLVYVKKNQN